VVVRDLSPLVPADEGDGGKTLPDGDEGVGREVVEGLPGAEELPSRLGPELGGQLPGQLHQPPIGREGDEHPLRRHEPELAAPRLSKLMKTVPGRSSRPGPFIQAAIPRRPTSSDPVKRKRTSTSSGTGMEVSSAPEAAPPVPAGAMRSARARAMAVPEPLSLAPVMSRASPLQPRRKPMVAARSPICPRRTGAAHHR